MSTIAQERCKGRANARRGLLVGPFRCRVFVVAQAVHDRRVLGEDNGCGGSLHCDGVRGHGVKVVHNEASQPFVPIRSKKPGCAERKSSANSRSFPELDGSVNGLETVGTLRFSQVYGQLANEVASLKTKVVGADVLFHLESAKGIGPQVLYDAPQFHTIIESFTPQ